MVLITGATGFLGKYIVKTLNHKGYDLRLLVRNAKERELVWLPDSGGVSSNGQTATPKIEIVEGDILDLPSLIRAMEGVDMVVHAAAVVSFWKRKQKEMMEVNVKGTASVVDVCLAYGIEKLVHVSSIAALGKTKENELITEKTPWKVSRYTSDYAKSKYFAELEIYRGIAEGLFATIVNPGVILGSDTQWSDGTPKLFNIVHEGLSYYNQAHHGVVGAEDVAKAITLLMEEKIPNGERFILVAENMSQQVLFTLIAEYLHKKAPSKVLSPFMSIAAGYFSQWMARLSDSEPIITVASMRSAISSYKYDGTKLAELGFAYTPVEKVIAETAQQFLKDQKEN